MEITWSRVAKRQLDSLDARYRQKIKRKLLALNDHNAQALDVKKLLARVGHYRLRVGDYRVVFTLAGDDNVCHVVAVKRRTSTTYLHEECMPYGYSAN